MTHPSYLIPSGEYSSEIVITKSRFISTIRRITSLADMRAFYKELQGLHPKANHNCWGAIAEAPTNSEGYGFSDDGEPNGTAGKPIFKVLQYSGIGQVGLIVTRYFGGVKLGTGGLVRAYTEAAKIILDCAKFEQFFKKIVLHCTLPYDQEGTFRYLLEQHALHDAMFYYTDEVKVDVVIAETQSEMIQKSLKTRLGHALIITTQK